MCQQTLLCSNLPASPTISTEGSRNESLDDKPFVAVEFPYFRESCTDEIDCMQNCNRRVKYDDEGQSGGCFQELMVLCL